MRETINAEIDHIVVNKIYTIRGQNVMLDSDLAALYGVETKRLNEQIRRNIKRFPKDFMFQSLDVLQTLFIAKTLLAKPD